MGQTNGLDRSLLRRLQYPGTRFQTSLIIGSTRWSATQTRRRTVGVGIFCQSAATELTDEGSMPSVAQDTHQATRDTVQHPGQQPVEDWPVTQRFR